MRFLSTIRQSIETHKLLSSGDRVLVGVSGGADSIGLLHVLSRLRHSLGIHLFGAHINHQLRKEAVTEQKQVENFCRSLGINCVTRKIRVMKNAKGSLEENLRRKRLRVLAAIARKHKVEVIALGHHQDDQAETILMRMIRGTGTLGLQGILPRRAMDDLTIIRPFLPVRKKDITGYLQKQGIGFCEDSSNQDLRFFRNRIRHQLIPILTSYNPRIVENLANLSGHLAVDYDFLEQEANKIFDKMARPTPGNTITLEFQELTGLPESLQRLVLRQCLRQISSQKRSLDFRHILEIKNLALTRPTGSVVDLPLKLFVKKTAKNLTFGRRNRSFQKK